MLLCDFGNLEREVARLEGAQVRGLHLDVMDGEFVPNLSYGLPIVEAFRRLTDLPLDVHLMIANPDRYVEQFFQAGADLITIHIEAAEQPRPTLEKIRDLGAAAGIALNPSTPLAALDGCWDLFDLVLVMSVEPGFGGQAFHPVALEKLAQLRKQVAPETLLAVDGGINRETIGPCASAGAQLHVVGSAIFRHDEYGPVLDELTRLATR